MNFRTFSRNFQNDRLVREGGIKLLRNVELFVLDMDGTIHIDGEIFPWTLPFLNRIRDLGKKYVFLTNNSSKGPEDYEEDLKKMGIQDPKVYTSGEATAFYIKEKFGNIRVFILGTRKLVRVFERSGLIFDEDNPEVLVLGYDTEITYEKIRKFAIFLRKGLPYISTHPDLNCPSKEGLIPDAGSFIALFKASTGREPEKIVGKPNPQMLYSLSEKYSTPVEKIAVIGDRLYTDMKLAKNSGAASVLVLSGETSREDLERSDLVPDVVVNNLGDLIGVI